MNRWAPQIVLAAVLTAAAFVAWTLHSVTKAVRLP
jgi:hypothetical protein